MDLEEDEGVGPGGISYDLIGECSYPVPSSPTISISNVEVTQGVNNFTMNGQAPSGLNPIALVQGRNTAIFVTVSAQNVSPSDFSNISVTASLPDGSQASGQVGIQAAAGSALVSLSLFTPVGASTSESLIVNATDSADGATSASPVTLPVSVTQTHSLPLVYFPMDGVSGNVSQSSFLADINSANQLIQGMYPIPENGVSSLAEGPITTSTFAGNSDSESTAILADLAQLQFQAVIVNPAVKDAIGIVPASYFSDRGRASTIGITPSIGAAPYRDLPALVTDGYWATTAHEIGHNFGLDHVSEVPTVNGYWVDQNDPISGWIDLMVTGSPLLFQNLSSAWVSSTEYASLLKALQIAGPDPETVVVAGFLNQTGAATLKPLYFLPNGVATPVNSAADGTVTALDSNNSNISQASFFSSYSMETDSGTSIPVDSSFFIVQLPLSQGATSIQVAENGKVISTIEPNSALLLNAVEEIPSTSFNKNAKQEEQTLVFQAQGIEELLSSCARIPSNRIVDNWLRVVCTDGAEELVLALRREVDGDLNESSVTTSPLQMTKGQVLSTVDFVTLQLLGSPTIQAAGHEVIVKVLPNDSEGILSITSVTQGQFGLVAIGRNGTITYKPDPGKPQPDSFTVTIADGEGASLSETVSIVSPCLGDLSIGRWAKRF